MLLLRRKKLFNKPLKILLFTNSIILVAGAMLGPIYALFVEKIGGDLLDASLTGSVFAITAGLTTLISGRFSDKIKENELVIIVGYLLMGIAFLLLSVTDTLLMLLAVQVLIGLGEAIYSPAFDSIYSKNLTKNHASKQWAAWESMNYFSIAIGAVLGGLIATSLGFNILFIIMSLLAFTSAIYIFFLPRKIL